MGIVQMHIVLHLEMLIGKTRNILYQFKIIFPIFKQPIIHFDMRMNLITIKLILRILSTFFQFFQNYFGRQFLNRCIFRFKEINYIYNIIIVYR